MFINLPLLLLLAVASSGANAQVTGGGVATASNPNGGHSSLESSSTIGPDSGSDDRVPAASVVRGSTFV